MKTHSKRYTESSKQLDTAKMHSLKEAIAFLKKLPQPKFDSSIDLHFHLNVDPKKSDQLVRGTVVLPHGTGKKVRVAVFCKGKVLGPRGLMPSPKTGTVTNDIKKAIEDVKKGKVEFRTDKQSGIHLSVGKMSFSEDKLFDNASCVLNAINEAKPGSVKGKYLKSLSIASSMNPGLNIAV
jgi:large subunit ribosomal protein L1